MATGATTAFGPEHQGEQQNNKKWNMAIPHSNRFLKSPCSGISWGIGCRKRLSSVKALGKVSKQRVGRV